MADEFGFRVLEPGRKSIDIIQDELRRQIGAFLAEERQQPGERLARDAQPT